MLFSGGGSSPLALALSLFFFNTIALRLTPLAQFAVNKINWRTDKGIKCCSASQ